MNIMDVWPLILQSVNDAWNLNWDGLVYRREPQVIRAVVFLAAVFFTTMAVRWWRFARNKRRSNSHYHTGLVIKKKQYGPGIRYKLVRGFTWTLAFVSLCFLGIALADPAVITIETTEQIESREIIYVYDVSASNGFHLPNSKIARGELARETLNKLILKRKEKMDRAAYIVFATQSEIWSGFTTDHESLMFSISMSPIAIAPTGAETIMWPGMFILKKGKYVEHGNAGGTNLHLGLESAIYLFDRKGSPKITEELNRNPNAKMRSIVIITDGAADVDPEPQFRELQKRRVIPYLIFVDPTREIEKNIYGEKDPKAQLPDRLLAMVRRSGGQYFMARDRQSIDYISEQLDKLQSVKQTKTVFTREDEVYFIPLSISFLFAVASMTMRFLFLFAWRKV